MSCTRDRQQGAVRHRSWTAQRHQAERAPIVPTRWLLETGQLPSKCPVAGDITILKKLRRLNTGAKTFGILNLCLLLKRFTVRGSRIEYLESQTVIFAFQTPRPVSAFWTRSERGCRVVTAAHIVTSRSPQIHADSPVKCDPHICPRGHFLKPACFTAPLAHTGHSTGPLRCRSGLKPLGYTECPRTPTMTISGYPNEVY
jgi:hypothetical protein